MIRLILEVLNTVTNPYRCESIVLENSFLCEKGGSGYHMSTIPYAIELFMGSCSWDGHHRVY